MLKLMQTLAVLSTVIGLILICLATVSNFSDVLFFKKFATGNLAGAVFLANGIMFAIISEKKFVRKKR